MPQTITLSEEQRRRRRVVTYGMARTEGLSHEDALHRAGIKAGDDGDERLEAHVPERRPQCREM